MRILLINSTYPPETIVAGRMAADLAVALHTVGHDVKVICPYPSRRVSAKLPEALVRDRVLTRKEMGVLVTRVPSYVAPQSKLLPRMRESWSFGRWAASLLEDPDWRPDVIYEDAWPMFAQAFVSQKAAQLRIPRVSHIMDLYPESAFVKYPVWMSAFFGRFLLNLDRANARRAAKLVVLSEEMRKSYELKRGIPSRNIEIIYTWQDEQMFLKLPDRETAGRHYGISTELFNFFFLGNIGPVAGVEHLIQSYAQAAVPDSQLLVVGEGSHRENCVKLAAHTKAPIKFLSDSLVEHVPLLQAMADICLVPIKRDAGLSSVPSKLSGYMLSGKSILAPLDSGSETARIIRAADCGWIIEPENVEALARTMRELRQTQAAVLSAAGARGRAYALQHLSKTEGVKKLARVILDVASAGAPAQG